MHLGLRSDRHRRPPGQRAARRCHRGLRSGRVPRPSIPRPSRPPRPRRRTLPKTDRPLVITLGGGTDKDSGNTEGGVGRDYLLANGIPFANIIAETRSIDTEQQVHRLAAIARENNLHHIVVVSDGTHLFRIRKLCEDAGLDVYTSPRPLLGHISNYDLFMRYVHEIISYTALRLNVNVGFLHSWLEGKPDV
ncbi:YdcF family protein [Tunturiibacter gelidiferens]|uniref:YdcF family protein n=1 Tax=Tunturiibacter gelidiferens TaxID=3069689 RepID=UPI003D9B8357